MAIITFNIPNQQYVNDIKNALSTLHPIPMIPDPGWVDPGNGTEAPLIPEFTKAAWVKECIRRWVRNQVARYKQKIARDAIIFTIEDGEIS